MLTQLRRFERLIARALAILLAAMILLGTVDLAFTLVKEVFYEAPRFFVGVDRLVDLFGLFLVILLGLELLETVKAYLRDDVIRAEVVLIVAIIALARKAIILELKEPTPLTLIGLAALILAVAAGYRLILDVLRNNDKSNGL